MPKKDGREVLQELKSRHELQAIPVVIFSTTSNEEEIARCYQLGADDYITKPSSFDTLVNVISTLRNSIQSPTGNDSQRN